MLLEYLAHPPRITLRAAEVYMTKHSFVHAKIPQYAQRPERDPSGFSYIKHLLMMWKQNWQTRRQLAQLSAEDLRDIGLTESQRQEELNKSFWEP